MRYRRFGLAVAVAAAGVTLALAMQGRRDDRPQMTRAERLRRLEQAEFAFDETGSGAVSRIAVADDRLFAFRIDGRVTRQDVKAMARLLEAAFDAWEDIDILLSMPDYEGIDIDAMLNSDMARAMVRSNRHVRRYAVVGPPSWDAAMIRIFDPLIPVRARAFALAQEREAWDWVRAGRQADGATARAAADTDTTQAAAP